MQLEGTLPEANPGQMTSEKDTTALKRPHRYPHKSATAGHLCPLVEGSARSRLTVNGFQ